MRDHHGNDGDNTEKKLEGDVGPGVHIGQKEREHGGHSRGAEGEDQGVQEDIGKGRISVGLHVFLHREDAQAAEPFRKTPQYEHKHRADRQEPDDEDEHWREGNTFGHQGSCLVQGST